jgi:hypothetical protein
MPKRVVKGVVIGDSDDIFAISILLNVKLQSNQGGLKTISR